MYEVLPFEVDKLKTIFLENVQVVDVDLVNSRIDTDKCLTYLANLGIGFNFDQNISKEKKFEILDRFAANKYLIKSEQLGQTYANLLLLDKCSEYVESETILSKEEADEYISINRTKFDLYREYFESVPNMILELVGFIKPENKKSDKEINVNVMRVAGLEGFIEYYISSSDYKYSTNFEHTSKAGNHHIIEVIAARNSNELLGFAYSLTKPLDYYHV